MRNVFRKKQEPDAVAEDFKATTTVCKKCGVLYRGDGGSGAWCASMLLGWDLAVDMWHCVSDSSLLLKSVGSDRFCSRCRNELNEKRNLLLWVCNNDDILADLKTVRAQAEKDAAKKSEDEEE